MNIIFGPRLIEESVFLAQQNSQHAAQFQEQRGQIYELADASERDRRFSALNHAWFERLGLGKVIGACLQEHPLISAHVESTYVVGATLSKEEGAELFVAPEDQNEGRSRRTLRLLLRPGSLLDEAALRPFLRQELFHISDMLDPAFAYEPTLPRVAGGPTYDTLITNRYRVLWDVTIAGRMAHRGWCDAAIREYQLDDFRNAFPMLELQCEEYFTRFFETAQPCHQNLAAFAVDPRAVSNHAPNQAFAASHCSLCRFPSHAFESAPANLGATVLAAIKGDFPDWTPDKGLCVQCADLYRGRRLSMAALELLPGWSATRRPASE